MGAVEQGRQKASPTAVDVMVKMAGQLGRVDGKLDQVIERVGELNEGQQQLAAATEHSVERLGAIEARLTEGDRRMQQAEDRIRALEEKQSKPGGGPSSSSPFSRVEPFVKFAKEYGPWLVAGGIAAYGFLVALLKGADPK